MIEEAGRQMLVINTATPQGTLQWNFIETVVYGWASSSIPPPVVHA